jgi:hypothetical protein
VIKKSLKDELDLSVKELVASFNAFEKAAKKFLSISDKICKQKGKGSRDLPKEVKRIREFLVQITDESGQMEKLSFGLKYTPNERDDQE